MVHVHGARVQAQTEILRRARLDQLVAVAADLPADWEVVELNPARVAQQRKRSGQGGVKTDLVDCAAVRVSVELAATVRR